MSERLPYEEQLQQQWNDLPLPDENMAWADMKRRLDDDDDDGAIVWWRRGCALWGLLLIVLLGLGWWIVRPEKWFKNKTETTAQHPTTTPDTTNNKSQAGTPGNKNENNNNDNSERGSDTDRDQNTSKTDNTTTTTTPGGNEVLTQPADPSQKGNDRTSVTIQPGEAGKTPATTKPGQPAISHTENNQADIKSNRAATGRRTRNNASGGKPSVSKPVITTTSGRHNGSKVPPQRNNTAKINNNNRSNDPTRPVQTDKPITGNDKQDNNRNNDKNKPVVTDTAGVTKTAETPKQPNITTPDSVARTTKKDSVKPKQPVAQKTNPDSTKKKKSPLFLSAGVAVQQQLPIAGQKATPYSSTGRKGSLADYIPSVYVRLNKKDKWFIQGEFKYGAPQYTKEFIYRQQRTDSAGVAQRIDTTTTNRLKKTFYHQLPLTFNYFVRPNWSIGAGVVWNKFKGAVADKEVIRRNNQNQTQTVLFKGIVAETDSAAEFAKSVFQLAFETQYQWRRFSIGARYAFGLQPYIRYTIPNTGPREEKNSSVQVFLRYQLWKQNKD